MKNILYTISAFLFSGVALEAAAKDQRELFIENSVSTVGPSVARDIERALRPCFPNFTITGTVEAQSIVAEGEVEEGGTMSEWFFFKAGAKAYLGDVYRANFTGSSQTTVTVAILGTRVGAAERIITSTGNRNWTKSTTHSETFDERILLNGSASVEALWSYGPIDGSERYAQIVTTKAGDVVRTTVLTCRPA